MHGQVVTRSRGALSSIAPSGLWGCRWKLIGASTHLLLLVVNHEVVRLDVTVHDASGVAEVKRLEQLIQVEPDVVQIEPREEELSTARTRREHEKQSEAGRERIRSVDEKDATGRRRGWG